MVHLPFILVEQTLSYHLPFTVVRSSRVWMHVDSTCRDVAVGNVLPPGGGANVARMAQLYAGIPYT